MLRPSSSCETSTHQQAVELAEAFKLGTEGKGDAFTWSWLRERCSRCGACAAMLALFSITPGTQPARDLDGWLAPVGECLQAIRPLQANLN